jgi:hypothetical protein
LRSLLRGAGCCQVEKSGSRGFRHPGCVLTASHLVRFDHVRVALDVATMRGYFLLM